MGKRKTISIFLTVLLMVGIFIQSPIMSYGSTTAEEVLRPEVYIDGNNIPCSGTNFIYMVSDDTTNVILQVNSLYSIRYDTEPTVHMNSFSTTINVEHDNNYHSVTIKKDDSLPSIQYWITVKRQTPVEEGNVGGGGGGGSTTENPTTPVDTTIDPITNTVVVSVSETQLASLFAMLQNNANEVKLAIIKIPKVTGLDNYGIQLPVSAFTASNSSGIRLETDIGTMTLMDTMLQNIIQATESRNVKFNMGYVDISTLDQTVQDTIGNHPIIRLNMELDGTVAEWSNPNSPVIISVPYTPTAEELLYPEKIVIYYIDGQGNIVTIPNGRYDSITGNVVFTTTHFSDYAIGYNDKVFSDITNQEVKHAVEILAAKGIVNGKTNTTFAPNDTLTRAEFITILDRAFELNTDFTENFVDVDVNKYYYKSVGIAKELEIVNGVGDYNFDPNGLLTKKQVEAIIERTLSAKRITKDNLIALVSGIDDSGGITRDEVCLLIYYLVK